MLMLQCYTKARGWQSVGAPYELGAAARVQQSCAILSHATGVVWRVLSSAGDVLTLWNGSRWVRAVEKTAAPTSWWSQLPDTGPDTVPARHQP